MVEKISGSPTFGELEHSGWQAKAEGYDRVVGGVTGQAVEPLLDAAAVDRGKRVLDVASGPGYGAGGAVSRGATTIGLDFAASMVELASRNYRDVDFREGDGQNLPFSAASFDAVICLFGLLHMPDPEKAITEAGRVLRPKGRYAFTVWDTPEKHEFFAIVLAAIRKFGDVDIPLPPSPPMFRFSDPDECRTVLAGAGFTDIDVRTIEPVWRGRTGRECLDLIYSGTVRTAKLLERQAPEALDEIHRAIIDGAEEYRKGDVIELAWPAVLTSAAKP